MLVHITFEKLTGMKGTFEGVFYCNQVISKEIPIVFSGYYLSNQEFVFTQDGKYFFMRAVQPMETLNYFEHFFYGVNFMIKEWSYGRKHKGYCQNLN